MAKHKRADLEASLPPVRDVLDLLGGDQPSAAQPGAKAKKPEKRPLTTFRLAADVRAALYELAEAEAVSPAELAELAISRLLADIEAGRFDLAAEKEAATWKIRR